MQVKAAFPLAHMGAELLQGEAAEAGAEGPPADPAIEVAVLVLQRRRIQRLVIVAGEEELDGGAAGGKAEALDDEGRIGRIEVVSLALAHGDVSAVRRGLHGEEEEPKHGAIGDLAALVEDPSVAVHSVPVLPHARIVVRAVEARQHSYTTS